MNTKEVIEAVRSGVSGIHIQGQDFPRVDEDIEFIASKLNFKVCEWNWGYGWVDFKNKRPHKTDSKVSLYDDIKSIANDDPTQRIYVIKNVHSALKQDPSAAARLQQEILRIKRHFQGQSAIFLVGKEILDFSELKDLLVAFPCPPLDSAQVKKTLNAFISKNSVEASTEARDALISICSGMEQNLVLQIFEKLKNLDEGTLKKESVENIALTLKKKALSQSGLLEIVDATVSIDEIGGLGHLKSWLRDKKRIINDLSRAEDFGIAAPKGVLLAGMPGCGKSMSAKAAASLFNVPLLRLDIGSLMGKFVGESEANMKAALSVAEKASPCVLWIDELEKAFSGVNGSGGSTEITTRLFGYFLTWMQEKPGAVFVIATANDITTIPPELLRRGRFDEIFFIDLPNHYERKQIFKVKVKGNGSSLTYDELDFEELAAESKGFSGSDIESVVNDALERLFRRSETVLTQNILKKYIKLTTPISVVLKDKITHYQELFKKFSLKPASFSKEDLRRQVMEEAVMKGLKSLRHFSRYELLSILRRVYDLELMRVWDTLEELKERERESREWVCCLSDLSPWVLLSVVNVLEDLGYLCVLEDLGDLSALSLCDFWGHPSPLEDFEGEDLEDFKKALRGIGEDQGQPFDEPLVVLALAVGVGWSLVEGGIECMEDWEFLKNLETWVESMKTSTYISLDDQLNKNILKLLDLNHLENLETLGLERLTCLEATMVLVKEWEKEMKNL